MPRSTLSPGCGTDTDADHDQIRVQLLASGKRHRMLRDRGDSRTEMKPHTVLFMDRAHHLSDRRAHNTLHRVRLRRNDVHLQIPATERGRHF